MNKRLKEILKEYEKRKHKIIKGDESMNIVVEIKLIKNDKKSPLIY